MNTAARHVVLGELIGVHGVRGALKMRSYCDPPERIFRYKNLQLRRGDALHPLVILSRKISKNDFIIEIEGISDRDASTTWLGSALVVDRATLPRPAPGEYYWADLEGLRVSNADGSDFGRVLRLFNSGASDVLVVVSNDDPPRERLIPFVHGSYVTAVDLEAGLLTVDWDPEL